MNKIIRKAAVVLALAGGGLGISATAASAAPSGHGSSCVTGWAPAPPALVQITYGSPPQTEYVPVSTPGALVPFSVCAA